VTCPPLPLALALTIALGWASSAHGQRPVPGANPAFPRLKYADSLISLNDRCMVRGSPLNPRIRPVYISGQPVGFC
jgi:hypothetical protein